jgi:hypothetical protein
MPFVLIEQAGTSAWSNLRGEYNVSSSNGLYGVNLQALLPPGWIPMSITGIAAMGGILCPAHAALVEADIQSTVGSLVAQFPNGPFAQASAAYEAQVAAATNNAVNITA